MTQSIRNLKITCEKQVNATKEYIWQTILKFKFQNNNLHKQVALRFIVFIRSLHQSDSDKDHFI